MSHNERYNLNLKDDSTLYGLSAEEIAEQIACGKAKLDSMACPIGKSRMQRADTLIRGLSALVEESQSRATKLAVKPVLMTTEPWPQGYRIKERMGIVSAESALGMNIVRDLFAGVRDIVGGQSASTRKILKQSREHVMRDLQVEARSLNANAVIGIDFDYHEFSGQGKSMILVVATGTAVSIMEETSATTRTIEGPPSTSQSV